MSLFSELGRRVESLKQSATAAKSEGAAHRCAECETLLSTEVEDCPECGADAVDPLTDD